VVKEDPAIMGLPNEICTLITLDHHSMCRFPNEKNQNYLPVEKAIVKLVNLATRSEDSKQSLTIEKPINESQWVTPSLSLTGYKRPATPTEMEIAPLPGPSKRTNTLPIIHRTGSPDPLGLPPALPISQPGVLTITFTGDYGKTISVPLHYPLSELTYILFPAYCGRKLSTNYAVCGAHSYNVRYMG
jgi:hypothetical protein